MRMLGEQSGKKLSHLLSPALSDQLLEAASPLSRQGSSFVNSPPCSKCSYELRSLSSNPAVLLLEVILSHSCSAPWLVLRTPNRMKSQALAFWTWSLTLLKQHLLQDVAFASPVAECPGGRAEQLPWKAVLQPGPLPPQAVSLRGVWGPRAAEKQLAVPAGSPRGVRNINLIELTV